MQIITPFITFVGGFYTRWYFDRRTSNQSLYRDILSTYLSSTDNESKGDVTSSRLCALQRAGALRLGETDFKQLLSDANAHGRPLPESDPMLAFLGVREALKLAQKHDLDLSKPDVIQRCILTAMARLTDKGRAINQRSVLRESEAQNDTANA